MISQYLIFDCVSDITEYLYFKENYGWIDKELEKNYKHSSELENISDIDLTKCPSSWLNVGDEVLTFESIEVNTQTENFNISPCPISWLSNRNMIEEELEPKNDEKFENNEEFETKKQRII